MMFLDVVSVGEMFKLVSCHPICFKKGTFKKKNAIKARGSTATKMWTGWMGDG